MKTEYTGRVKLEYNNTIVFSKYYRSRWHRRQLIKLFRNLYGEMIRKCNIIMTPDIQNLYE